MGINISKYGNYYLKIWELISQNMGIIISKYGY